MRTTLYSSRRRPGGFTLIELLVVVAIIIILAAILLPVVSAARRKARRAVAVTEVLTIERGLKSYLDEYLTGPTNFVAGVTLLAREKAVIPIEGKFARLLQGEDISGDNRKRLRFVQFKFMDTAQNPVNPWGTRYYAKLDFTFDEAIEAGTGEPLDPPNQKITDRRVIVWTSDMTATTNSLIRSWR